MLYLPHLPWRNVPLSSQSMYMGEQRDFENYESHITSYTHTHPTHVCTQYSTPYTSYTHVCTPCPILYTSYTRVLSISHSVQILHTCALNIPHHTHPTHTCALHVLNYTHPTHKCNTHVYPLYPINTHPTTHMCTFNAESFLISIHIPFPPTRRRL